MNFLKPLTNKQLQNTIASLSIRQFNELYEFTEEIFDTLLILGLPKFAVEKTARYNVRHHEFVELFTKLFSDDRFKEKLYKKLISNNTSKKLYQELIWNNKQYPTKKAIENFGLKVYDFKFGNFGNGNEKLKDELSLINRDTYKSFKVDVDKLFIEKDLRELLKFSFELPDDYQIKAIKMCEETQYSYTNEQGVFSFIENIEQMLQNQLVEFGKTNEKPLAKTLNLLKTSSGVDEFYPNNKKANSLSIDMLTRSFYYYYNSKKRFRETPLQTLTDFITVQFNDQMPFFISRIFTSHLKKVRFDEYYTSQTQLFDMIKLIINHMPLEHWVSVENIINYCKYRDYRFDLESKYKTDDYNIDCDINYHGEKLVDNISAYSYYEEIFLEPVLKATFFYLSSLGVFEIKYNTPKSSYNITAKGLPYISVWDSIKYIRLTKLGLYTLGKIKEYKVKAIEKKETKTKFDIYKPIISVEDQDTLMLAKIEPYTEKYDQNRYILSYSKVFRDCKDIKSLKSKIDGFYKNIESKPPQVFVRFFDEILDNANMLKHEQIYYTIELVNNKKLLNLFMTNKKLQELTIKAQGYKILVLKKDLSKLTRIVKDNGFFVEF